MRVTTEQLRIVKKLSQKYFGKDVRPWLFGSRVNDERKGGDYDFLVETSLANPDEIISCKIDMILKLQSSEPFEDEKIDLIVKRRHSSFDMAMSYCQIWCLSIKSSGDLTVRYYFNTVFKLNTFDDLTQETKAS